MKVLRKRSRYGPFSLKDARLLENCINALQKLEKGSVSPQTELQRQFLRVVKGKISPTTKYEIAYMRWRHSKPDIASMLARSKAANRKVRGLKSDELRKFEGEEKNPSECENVTLHNGGLSIDEQDRLRHSTQERLSKAKDIGPNRNFEPRKLQETWGDREAWKIDSDKNKYNGR